MSWSRIFDRPTGDGSPLPLPAPVVRGSLPAPVKLPRSRSRLAPGAGPGLTRKELCLEVARFKEQEMSGHVLPEQQQVDQACAYALHFADSHGWEPDALLYVEMRGRADQSGVPTNADSFGVYVERRGLVTDHPPEPDDIQHLPATESPKLLSDGK